MDRGLKEPSTNRVNVFQQVGTLPSTEGLIELGVQYKRDFEMFLWEQHIPEDATILGWSFGVPGSHIMECRLPELRGFVEIVWPV